MLLNARRAGSFFSPGSRVVITASGRNASSSDYLALPLSEMQAIISRFHQRVSASFQKHPSTIESVRKALRHQGV